MKLQLLAFLLFSTLESVHRLAAAFGGGDDEYALDESAEALLPGPHAALRCLIRLDAGMCHSQPQCAVHSLLILPLAPCSSSSWPAHFIDHSLAYELTALSVSYAGAVLMILKQALESWDATESDLADAASIFMVPPPEAFQSACSATQAVVDALIRVVQAERPQPGLSAPSKAGALGSGNARAQSLAFVAEFVTAGRATVQLQDALPILQCLAERSEVRIGPKTPF